MFSANGPFAWPTATRRMTRQTPGFAVALAAPEMVVVARGSAGILLRPHLHTAGGGESPAGGGIPVAYLIGTDEAGYGPNLGPLVISASLWWVDDLELDLDGHLAEVVVRGVPRPGDGRLPIADSKLLYKSGSGLELLELGVLAALGTLGTAPDTWQQLWQTLASGPGRPPDDLPWHEGYQLLLPTAASRERLAALEAGLRRAMATGVVRLMALRSRAVFPREFNDRTEAAGNKSRVLSELTLELAGELLALAAGGPTRMVCDKHGGRNRYAALLQRQFPEALVEVRQEGQAQSVYRWGPAAERVEAVFRIGAEAWLPTALASMASKYVRELSMRAFNDFWRRRIDGLRPTAGYPTDALRFKSQIAAAQAALNIPDRALWRVK